MTHFVFWKDETYKICDALSAEYYGNDPDWLFTIPVSDVVELIYQTILSENGKSMV